MEKLIFMLALAVCYSGAVPVNENTGSNRIISGDVAGSNSFPYAASLQLREAALPLRGHRCGGVLITRQATLTAASCLYDTNSNGEPQLIQAALYQVFAGARFLNDSSADRIRPVSNFAIHPNFTHTSHWNDIAVIRLTTAFPTSVVTISLPSADHNPADFTECTVAGWGGTNTASLGSPELRFMRKYVYNQNQCTSVYNPNMQLPNIMPSMVCAASFDSISASCTGDIGNALVCDDTLTGVLFHGLSCGPTTLPELYTRVNDYTTWIRSVSGSNNIFAPGVFMLLLLSMVTFI